MKIAPKIWKRRFRSGKIADWGRCKSKWKRGLSNCCISCECAAWADLHWCDHLSSSLRPSDASSLPPEICLPWWRLQALMVVSRLWKKVKIIPTIDSQTPTWCRNSDSAVMQLVWVSRCRKAPQLKVTSSFCPFTLWSKQRPTLSQHKWYFWSKRDSFVRPKVTFSDQNGTIFWNQQCWPKVSPTVSLPCAGHHA